MIRKLLELFGLVSPSLPTKEETQLPKKDCLCTKGYQVIGCPAYDLGKCIWHPDNDPYDLKNREWVNGEFVKKMKD